MIEPSSAIPVNANLSIMLILQGLRANRRTPKPSCLVVRRRAPVTSRQPGQLRLTRFGRPGPGGHGHPRNSAHRLRQYCYAERASRDEPPSRATGLNASLRRLRALRRLRGLQSPAARSGDPSGGQHRSRGACARQIEPLDVGAGYAHASYVHRMAPTGIESGTAARPETTDDD